MIRLLPLLALVACNPVHAQNMQCGAHAEVIVGLADRYGENRRMSGLDGGGNVIEIFANTATGTWTALIVQPNGMACMVAAGENFDSTVSDLPPEL